MRMKKPTGDLVWMTPLLVIGGFFLAYISMRDGSPGFAGIYGSLGFFSLLVWFDQKWVAFPLMAYFGIAVLGGIALLLANGSFVRLLGLLKRK